ncbi:MAG: STAS domain-containing protein [Nitrosomonadales bacterium]|nr:STAS domain-containing protein [Nitrosomonadales bacterium]
MIRREGERLLVSGRLTMDSIGTSFEEAMQPPEGKTWTVDLAGVEAADSAAVSMLLSWMRNAQRHDAKLAFVNVPDNLRSLAGLYGVAEALSLNHSSQ